MRGQMTASNRWVLDWAYGYQYDYRDVTNCDNYANIWKTALLDIDSRINRGGGWNYDAKALRAADRSNTSASIREVGLGFRCARDAPRD